MKTIGQLRHRITIEELTLVQNDSGGSAESWAPFKTVWANIESKLGNERAFAQRLEQNITHIIFIRFTEGVEPRMRISFGGKYFQIKSVVPLEQRKNHLMLLAQEGVGT